jgi:hypothetical protein
LALHEAQQRCAELTENQRAHGLSDQEQAELMALFHEIELFNAQQLRRLVNLANIRQASLEELMQHLAVQPVSFSPPTTTTDHTHV